MSRRLFLPGLFVIVALGLILPSPALAAIAQPEVAITEPSATARSFERSGNWFWATRVVWSAALPALVLFTGCSARLRTWAQRVGGRGLFGVAAFVAGWTIVEFVLSFPLNYAQGFVWLHAYELSTQTFGRWFAQSLKNHAIAGVLLGVAAWPLYQLVRRRPRRWWLPGGAVLAALVFVQMLVAPVWIDPLLNRFGPMQNQALAADLVALAERAGVAGGRVYEVNKSADTKGLNAYVAGFLGTKRIVLWDTLTARLNHDEVLAVMAHELGHYALHHAAKGFAIFAPLVLLALWLLERVGHALIQRFQVRFGFAELGDLASLPLVLLLYHLLLFVSAPLVCGVIRHFEHEADRFSVELTRDGHAAATAQVKLQESWLAVPWPNPVVRFFRGTHPSAGERIEFFNHYQPWRTGEPLRYEKYFRPVPAADSPGNPPRE